MPAGVKTCVMVKSLTHPLEAFTWPSPVEIIGIHSRLDGRFTYPDREICVAIFRSELGGRVCIPLLECSEWATVRNLPFLAEAAKCLLRWRTSTGIVFGCCCRL